MLQVLITQTEIPQQHEKAVTLATAILLTVTIKPQEYWNLFIWCNNQLGIEQSQIQSKKSFYYFCKACNTAFHLASPPNIKRRENQCHWFWPITRCFFTSKFLLLFGDFFILLDISVFVSIAFALNNILTVYLLLGHHFLITFCLFP